jgi:hypothetical protein
MDLRAVALLLIPLLLLGIGFVLALRAVRRSSATDRPGYTPDGERIFWSEPFARLQRAARGSPGRGNLILTGDCLRFERYLPRRVERVPLDRIASMRIEGPPHRGELVICLRGEEGEAEEMAFRVRDVTALSVSLEDLGLSPRTPPRAEPTG